MEERLKKLREKMEAKKWDAVYITSPYNRRYLSGFTGTAGSLLVTLEENVLFTDFRYLEQAAEQASAFEIVDHAGKLHDRVKEKMEACKCRRVGFEDRKVTFSDYETMREKWEPIELVPIHDLVEELRLIKEAKELSVIRKAVEIADQTFSHILTRLQPGVSEREIALELEFHMRRLGADGTSFETIVASGPRSALPHGVASDKNIQSGELVTLDFGAYYGGYCSDITRTVAVGDPGEELRNIYDIVKRAQQHAVDHIKPGMTGKEADALARDIIQNEGYGDDFGHGTGHGIGLEVHEGPRVSPPSKTVLQPGMVVTVEPGIYLPGKGGVRIEDDVLITEEGREILTRSDKDLHIL